MLPLWNLRDLVSRHFPILNEIPRRKKHIQHNCHKLFFTGEPCMNDTECKSEERCCIVSGLPGSCLHRDLTCPKPSYSKGNNFHIYK